MLIVSLTFLSVNIDYAIVNYSINLITIDLIYSHPQIYSR